ATRAARARTARCPGSGSGSAAAGSGSFDRLRTEEGLERLDIVTAAEREERLLGAGTMGEISFQHALDRLRRILGLHVPVDLAGEAGFGAEAAADQDVIALDSVTFFRSLDLAGEQADVTDVVLCAGVMAAGEMDVDRPVEAHTRLAPGGNRFGVSL